MFSLPPKRRLIDVGQSLTGMGVAAVFQLISFIVLTRTLGVSSFGIFISAIAIGLTISELIGLGCGENFIRVTARSKTVVGAAFKNGLRMIGQTGCLIALPLSLVAAYFLAPAGLFFPIALIILSEAIILRLTLYSEHVYLGLQNYKHAAVARAVVPGLRCIGIVVLIYAVGLQDMVSLIYIHIVMTVAAAVLMIGHSRHEVMKQNALHTGTNPSLETLRTWLGFGVPVSIANLQRGVQFHADKYVVTLVAGPEISGIYAAGFRVTQMGLLPVQAYIRTTYSGFFKAGDNGIGASIAYAKSVAGPLLALAVLCSVGVYIMSYFVVFLLGDAYADASQVVRFLAPLLVLWAVQYLLTDILMGADKVWPRIWASLAANVISLALIIGFTLHYGLTGTLVAAILSVAIFVVLLLTAVRLLLLHQ